MCFSTEADFAAAAVLTPIAVMSLRAAPTRAHLPIAALPAIFALHQFVEGFVWMGLPDATDTARFSVAVHVYLVIAQMLLPVLVPFGLALIEPERRRRLAMLACGAVGLLTAVRFGWIIFAHEVGATEQEHVIVYRTDLHIGPWATAGYVTATCAAVLLSSGPLIRAFGIVNVIGLCAAAIVRYEAVTSVWCLYAALVSVMLVFAMRAERRRLTPRTPSPAAG